MPSISFPWWNLQPICVFTAKWFARSGWRSAKDERTRATLLLMAQVWLRLGEEKVSRGTDEKV